MVKCSPPLIPRRTPLQVILLHVVPVYDIVVLIQDFDVHTWIESIWRGHGSSEWPKKFCDTFILDCICHDYQEAILTPWLCRRIEYMTRKLCPRTRHWIFSIIPTTNKLYVYPTSTNCKHRNESTVEKWTHNVFHKHSDIEIQIRGIDNYYRMVPYFMECPWLKVIPSRQKWSQSLTLQMYKPIK